MGALDRMRRALAERARAGRRAAPVGAFPRAAGPGARSAEPGATPPDEAVLWAVLKEDPNDTVAFHQLAEIVRRQAGEGHDGGDQQRAMDDAVWSLAEELAHSGKAWYPLIELARLSVHDDREAALRRLGTAADRDHTGQALAVGLRMLREEFLPGDALNLGTGHWRPRDHSLEVARQLVEAAIETGRYAEAERHLEAISTHSDLEGVEALRHELEPLIARARTRVPPGTPSGGMQLLDLREVREDAGRNPFRRRSG